MPGVPRVLLVRVDQESAQVDRYAPRLSLGEPIETSERECLRHGGTGSTHRTLPERRQLLRRIVGRGSPSPLEDITLSAVPDRWKRTTSRVRVNVSSSTNAMCFTKPAKVRLDGPRVSS